MEAYTMRNPHTPVEKEDARVLLPAERDFHLTAKMGVG